MRWTTRIVTIGCACVYVGCGDAPAPKPGSVREVALAVGDCGDASTTWISGPPGSAGTDVSLSFVPTLDVPFLPSSSGGLGFGRSGGASPRAEYPRIVIGQPLVVAVDADTSNYKPILRRYIKRNMPQLMSCYETALQRQRMLPSGTMTTNFVVTKEGTVGTAKAEGIDEQLAQCVSNVIIRIEFPKPKRGILKVSYPLQFERGPAEPELPAPPPSPPEPVREPGSGSPLRTVEKELAACVRALPVTHGVALIELGGTQPIARGIEDKAFVTCVGALKLPGAAKQVCPLAFGPLGVADAPGIEVGPETVTYAGLQIADPPIAADELPPPRLEPLVERLRTRVEAVRARPEPITIGGPLVLRAVDTAPMELVNRALRSAVASSDPPALAVQRAGHWELVRPRTLPLPPVPKAAAATSVDHRGRPGVRLSILVTEERTWVANGSDVTEVEANDTARLSAALARFAGPTSVEIAGEGSVTYGRLLDVIEHATKAGLPAWILVAPEALTTNPTL